MASLADLRHDPKNARKHTARNLGMIVDALHEVGAARSIVIDENNVVLAGNATVDAAAEAGIENVRIVEADGNEIIAVRRSGLSAKQKTRLALFDNRAAELAEWDTDVITALDAEEITGMFSDDELAAMLPEIVSDEDPDDFDAEEAAAAIAEPVTKPGDVWLLGKHRLICGDARNFGDIEKLFSSQKANVVVTSPPYASQRKYDESSGFKPIHPDEYVEWFTDVQTNVRTIMAEDGSFFVNIKEHCEDGQRHLYVKDLAVAAVRTWGWLFVDEFCWKRAGVPGGWNNRFKNAWEPVFHFSTQAAIKFRPDAVSHDTEHAFDYSQQNGKSKSGSGLLGKEHGARFRSGSARPSNVIEVGTGGSKVTGQHAAEYPVKLPEFFIRAFSDQGDVVFDPFMGSGTTLMAAETNGRVAYGVEISPRYCDVIVTRWEQFTGKKATLEQTDGQTET